MKRLQNENNIYAGFKNGKIMFRKMKCDCGCEQIVIQTFNELGEWTNSIENPTQKQTKKFFKSVDVILEFDKTNEQSYILSKKPICSKCEKALFDEYIKVTSVYDILFSSNRTDDLIFKSMKKAM